MMKKLLSVLWLLTICFWASAQVVTIRFSGESPSQEPLRLDSVDIVNNTRSWSEKLIYPDSVLTLGATGIEDAQAQGVSLECYPNPFSGTAMVGMHLDNNEKVLLQLFNLAGQKVAECSQSLSAGLHAFEVSVASAQIYLLSATTSKGRTSIKMVCQKAAEKNQIVSRGLMKLAVAKKVSSKPFRAGDRMSYLGYTTYEGKVYKSIEKSQAQRESENIVLLFGLGRVSVKTNSVDNIMNNSADVSITVEGLEIKSRGICWSLSPEPTMNDYHMSQSGGAGTLTFSLSNLTKGTTYHVRAYATGTTGTIYGNELTFTTTNVAFACGTSKVYDYDKNVYQTVQIGSQCWMKENLATSHYANGVAIEVGTAASIRPMCYYPGNSDMNYYAYGYLYNWAAVMHGAESCNTIPGKVQGVCPNGWHVPSKDELQMMLNYTKSKEEFWCNGEANNILKALADNICWNSFTSSFDSDTCVVGYNTYTNNTTGFSLRPAGIFYSGSFRNLGSHGYLWTSTQGYSKDYAAYLYSSNQSSTAEIYDNNAQMGLSVRCVYDEYLSEDSAMFICGTTKAKDYDGNEYASLRIGNQCWMKENVRSEHYLDGKPITKADKMLADSAYRYIPNNDPELVKQYGYLYNWKAMMNGAESGESVQGICPEGWHVPSDAEWMQMLNYLQKQFRYVCGEAPLSVAKALASKTDWKFCEMVKCAVGQELEANNESRFTALPVGSYENNASAGWTEKCCFWSSIANGNAANCYELQYDSPTVNCKSDKKEVGYAVRCVR